MTEKKYLREAGNKKKGWVTIMRIGQNQFVLFRVFF